MGAIVSINGRICGEQEAVISVFDHGFLFGDGIYEVVRTYNRQLFLLDRHLRRLRESARMIALEIPHDDASLEKAMREAMAAWTTGPGRDVPAAEVYVRVMVTRGPGDGTYDGASCPDPGVVIIVKALAPRPPAVYDSGVRVVMASLVRNHPGSVNPLIKSNNLLNNALAMREAIRQGAFEAVLKNYRGEIAECSQSNVFVVRRGVATTPALNAGLLAGITREFILDVAEEAGVAVVPGVVQEEDLYAADEAFLTSTTREVVPIVRVDERVIGNGVPGPITRRLLHVYRQKADLMTRSAL